MEGLLILMILGLLAFLGWYAYQYIFQSREVHFSPGFSGDPRGRKERVVQRVLQQVAKEMDSDLGITEIGLVHTDPAEVLTLWADIGQFEHLRPARGLLQWQGQFEERRMERQWSRRPRENRRWDGIETVVPLAFRVAFSADTGLDVVRFRIGDVHAHPQTWRVSVEGRQGGRQDWLYERGAGGYLAPITPHGEDPEPLSHQALASDATDFEHQVAEVIRSMGLTADVTGGSADGGVDIVAYDDSPITGGKYVVQCKRYGQSKKVGVGEVRELYGVVQAEGANKGILITSSSFTSHALAFSEGKPIELIDGTKLGLLLESAPAPLGQIAEVPYGKSGTGASERAALAALYNATGGANWLDNRGWLSDAPIDEWHGVNTYGSGRVIGLDLRDNQLSGQLPQELGRLTDLTLLRLSNNHLSEELPPELGRLSKLTLLYLNDNQLTGEVPSWLGRLPKLESLDLSDNQLSGELPPELGRLANLTLLHLSGNRLSGELPSWLGRLLKLDSLTLDGNQLSGELPPELGRLANLTLLHLSGNRLSGELRSWLGHLLNLDSLTLDGNQLSGELPPELGRLTDLTLLFLGGNQFTGCIPEGLRDIPENDLSDLGLPFCGT